MKIKIRFLLIIVSLSLFVGCGESTKIPIDSKFSGKILKEGFIDCYEPGLMASKDKPLYCETSAVLFADGKLWLGNDHQMPDKRSAVFAVDFSNSSSPEIGQPEYSEHPLLKKGSKYEEFALSPDENTVFLITGFDRIMEDGSDAWDGFNSFLYWPRGNEDAVKVISKNGKDSTSISYREDFSKVLANEEYPEFMPYFKIEGMAVLNDKIIFGIREYGKNYSEFEYAAKIIEVSYENNEGEIHLKEDFKIISDLKPNELNPSIKEPLALSSILYDSEKNRFFLLTSFEDDANNIGAYLWTADLSELKQNRMHPVKNTDGTHLSFTHKAEDMSFLDNRNILVIHDDDKEITRVGDIERQPHQAAYSIVELMD